MPVTLPLEVFEALEKGLGKDDARAVVKSIEATISEATEYKWATTKDELLDAIRREFVTKEEFRADIARLEGSVREDIARLEGSGKEDIARLEGEIKALRGDLGGEIKALRVDLGGEIKTVRVELEGKIERLNQKFNFMIILLVIALTLMNPVMAEIIKRLLRL